MTWNLSLHVTGYLQPQAAWSGRREGGVECQRDHGYTRLWRRRQTFGARVYRRCQHSSDNRRRHRGQNYLDTAHAPCGSQELRNVVVRWSLHPGIVFKGRYFSVLVAFTYAVPKRTLFFCNFHRFIVVNCSSEWNWHLSRGSVVTV